MDNSKVDLKTIETMINNFKQNLENEINDVIKDSTYSELTKYIDHLHFYLYSRGIDSKQEYYKKIVKLYNINTPEAEELKHKLYILWLYEDYETTIFSFDEFITYSRLLNITFEDYNPDNVPKIEKQSYKSDDKSIDFIVNEIVQEFINSPYRHPYPYIYDITEFRLKILLNTLQNKRIALLKSDIEKIDLDDLLLNNLLSKERIEKIKEKKNKSVCYSKNNMLI